MVSLSRISPIRMQSDAWRSELRSAVAKSLVSLPISRWLTIDFLFLKRYSIGSSKVRMWPGRSSFRWSSIEAMVVDLPEAVEPTSRISPRFSMIRFDGTGGSCKSARGGMVARTKRNTAEMAPRCLKADRRKRPSFGTDTPMFSSLVAASSSICAGETISASSEATFSG